MYVCLCVCSQQARCGYAIALMALYWCTECMPLAVTALLPVVLFPMMGIMKADEVKSTFQNIAMSLGYFAGKKVVLLVSSRGKIPEFFLLCLQTQPLQVDRPLLYVRLSCPLLVDSVVVIRFRSALSI